MDKISNECHCSLHFKNALIFEFCTMSNHCPSFLDNRTRRELLAHSLELCEREDKLLRYLHTFMSPNELPMATHFLDKMSLWDRIELPPIDKDMFANYGCRLINGIGTEGLSSDQVEKAITALAQFHASSMELPRLCGPDTFLSSLSHPKAENELAIKNWLLNVLLTLPECDYFRKKERPLRNFLHQIGFGLNEDKMGTNAGLPIVLCHGNFCADNIIFCSNGNNHQGKVPTDSSPIIFSWELAYLGYGISDMAHLLLSSVNSSLRIRLADQWVEFYVHKFEQFRQLRRSENANEKGGLVTKLLANKNKMERIKRQKQQFRASIPAQLLRVLPKLAMDYRKLIDAKANLEESDHYEWKGCALLGRMIGGFEMISKEFE